MLGVLKRQFLVSTDPRLCGIFSNPWHFLQKRFCVRYIGWVGHRNVGDDLIFEGICRLFPEWSFLSTIRGYALPLRAYSRLMLGKPRPFRAKLLGGGTLFPIKAFLDQILDGNEEDVPFLVFGLGALDRPFWKERLAEDFGDEALGRWVSALKGVVYLGVRDRESNADLQALGLKQVEVIGDPALAVGDDRWIRARDQTSGRKRPPRIGVNIGSHDPIWGDRAAFLSEMARFVESCLRKGWALSFIPLSPVDLEWFESLRELFPVKSLPMPEVSPRTGGTLSKLLANDVIVGQRLHSIIAACAFGVPTVPLAYNPKCLTFSQEFGRAGSALRTDEVTAERLLSATEGVLHRFDREVESTWRRAEEARHVLREATQSAKAAVIRAL